MSLTRTRAILLLGLGAVLAAATYLWVPGWDSHSQERVIEEQPAPGAADVVVEASESGAKDPAVGLRPKQVEEWTTDSALPPLVPVDAPLAAQLPALIERAEAGDPVASCRLIIASTRCKESARSAHMTRVARKALAKGPTKFEALIVDMVAATEEQISGGSCDGIRTAELPSTDDVYARAAAYMSPRQRTLLALMRSDGKIRRLHGDRYFTESAIYVVPQFVADHGFEFLMSGYRAYDPLALEGLVLLHAPGEAVKQQGVSPRLPNPRLFFQYALLMEELFGADSLSDGARMLMAATATTMTPRNSTK